MPFDQAAFSPLYRMLQNLLWDVCYMPNRRICLTSGCALALLHCIILVEGDSFLTFWSIIEGNAFNTSYLKIVNLTQDLTPRATTAATMCQLSRKHKAKCHLRMNKWTNERMNSRVNIAGNMKPSTNDQIMIDCYKTLDSFFSSFIFHHCSHVWIDWRPNATEWQIT